MMRIVIVKYYSLDRVESRWPNCRDKSSRPGSISENLFLGPNGFLFLHPYKRHSLGPWGRMVLGPFGGTEEWIIDCV
jgi:hypothetical protein